MENEHEFKVHQVPGEGVQASCKCGWRGGPVGKTATSVQSAWDALHMTVVEREAGAEEHLANPYGD